MPDLSVKQSFQQASLVVFDRNALQGRIALVTGAASGIGRETAVLLAKMGARVWATDVDVDGLASLAGGPEDRVEVVGHDVANADDWSAIADRIQGLEGRLDILVNNAGIMLTRPFLETSIDQWRHQQAVNVESVVLGVQACFALLTAARASDGSIPSIINISSVYGIVAGQNYAAYSASKGAVRALTKALAIEFAPHGVRVNSVHPGPTLTNLARDAPRPCHPDGAPMSDDEIYELWTRLIPWGRPGAASEIAMTVAFLASAGSAFMTGAELVADGGYLSR